jgi:hypothetical protein
VSERAGEGRGERESARARACARASGRERESARLQFASLLRTVPDAVVGMGADGLVSYWNDGASRLLGYVEDEVVPHIRRCLKNPSARIGVTGASFGAFHAANAFFRRPDLFDTLIGMSGFYDLRGDFGLDPADLYERYAFYLEAFPQIRTEVR